MTLHILDLNDTAVSLYRNTQLLVESPGFAVLDGAQIFMGREAQSRARVLPRHLNNRFWSQLNLDMMPHALGQWMRHADIAHAHLQAICRQAGDPEQIILAVPGSYHSDQLALLLGMARECSFKATGLVDAALAAAITLNTDKTNWMHLDLLLHQAVVTEFEVVHQRLQRRRVTPLPGMGLQALYDTWARYIADECIRQTRFDPKHTAASEQLLYNALPDWLRELTLKPQVTVQLQGHSFRLTRQSLVDSASVNYQALLNPIQQDAAVVLSHRAAKLPGFKALINNPYCLPENALVQGTKAAQQWICSDSTDLEFVTALPLLNSGNSQRQPMATKTVASEQHVDAVTHILWKNKAYPLTFSSAEDLGVGYRDFWIADRIANGKTGLSIGCDKAIACRIVQCGEQLHLQIEPGSERYISVHQLSHVDDDQRRLGCGDTIHITGEREVIRLIQVQSSHGNTRRDSDQV